MRINKENKSVDIEPRDLNYILPAYVVNYLFFTRNEDPEKIVFPMLRSIKHPTKPGVMIPIEYVPDSSPIALEIIEDGKDIPEASAASEAIADEREKTIETLKERIAELEASGLNAEEVEVELVSAEDAPAVVTVDTTNLQPTPERLAKVRKPETEVPPGSPLDGMAPRGREDQSMVAKALASQPEIDGTPSKPFEKKIKKNAGGKKIVVEEEEA